VESLGLGEVVDEREDIFKSDQVLALDIGKSVLFELAVKVLHLLLDRVTVGQLEAESVHQDFKAGPGSR